MSEAEQSRDTRQSVTGSSEGRLLAGRYRLGGVLGRGGMGTVWRALDEMLGRTVAVKELRFPSSIDDDEKRRLITRTLREAKAIARIRNSSAVTVYDVVEEDDRPWIVMELVEGKSLAELVREDGPLTPKRAAEVGLAILDVLRSAHREGILHRDVKPSNVLMSEDGRVVLTDFGIAQVEGDPSVTSTGMLVGAPSYISPERARGHKPGPAADLWSLGGLLYASVEGSPPYDRGSAIATLTAVMTEQLDPPKNAGPLKNVIYGLLEKDPARRLDDAGARALLEDIVKAPEPPKRAPAAAPDPAATRVVGRPSRPTAVTANDSAPTTSKAAAAPAADLVGGALRPVRAGGDSQPEPQPKPEPKPHLESGPGAVAGPVSPRASLTDVVPRRSLVIIAAVVAIVVITTVLIVSFGGGSAPGTDEDKASASSTSSGTSVPQGGGKAGTPGKSTAPGASTGGASAHEGESSDTSGDDEGDAGGKGKTGRLPAGYAMVTDRQFHFTMAMPEGFRKLGIAGQDSGGKYSENGGFPRIQVDYTNSPTNNAELAWTMLEEQTRGTFQQYQRVSIKAVQYHGYPTVADWQFKQTLDGERVRALDRGFKVDSTHGYAIVITCQDSEWNSAQCSTMRKTAFATFKPMG